MPLDPSRDPIPTSTQRGGEYRYTAKGRILGGFGRGQGQRTLDGPIPERGPKPPSTPDEAPVAVVRAAPPSRDRRPNSLVL